MLVTLVGLALILATAIALAWPLLSPPAEEGLDTAASPDAARRLHSERDAALAAIREADFDHETGKLSDEDYQALRTELEERALAVLAAIERSGGPSAGGGEKSTEAVEPIGGRPAGAAFCSICGHENRRGAAFCSRCGRAIARPPEAKRRRRA